MLRTFVNLFGSGDVLRSLVCGPFLAELEFRPYTEYESLLLLVDYLLKATFVLDDRFVEQHPLFGEQQIPSGVYALVDEGCLQNLMSGEIYKISENSYAYLLTCCLENA